MNIVHSALIVAITAGVTILIRFLPFLVFKNKVPDAILYLGKVLPFAIMGMLVVYCLKGVHFFSGNHGLPELIATALIFVLHKWKHNTLLSIVGGTVCYMVLIQLVFV